MARNFVIPITVAAVFHAALFAYPRSHATARGTSKPTAIESHDPITTIELAPPNSNDVEHAEQASGGAPMPDIPDIVSPATARDFTIPVRPTIDSNGVPDIKSIPADRPGPGTGTGTLSGLPAMPSWKDLDRKPNARVQVAPDYPPAARIDGRTGEVTVEFVVDENGRVLSPRAVGSTDRVFDEAAVRAVAKWRFEPGTVNGRAVRFRMAVPIVFNLGD